MTKRIFVLTNILIAVAMLAGCETSNSNHNVTVNSYKTVTFGNQVWMAENLDVDKFRNGDTILQAKTELEWYLAAKSGKPAWCYFLNDPEYGKKYGKIYNYYAVNDLRELAPEGWHVPTDSEWARLVTFLEPNAGKKMKSTSDWAANGNGTNESGFTALPAGARDEIGTFYGLTGRCAWWSSTETSANDKVWARGMIYYFDHVLREDAPKGFGAAVRCVKNY